jgi:hypothetical protein
MKHRKNKLPTNIVEDLKDLKDVEDSELENEIVSHPLDSFSMPSLPSLPLPVLEDVKDIKDIKDDKLAELPKIDKLYKYTVPENLLLNKESAAILLKNLDKNDDQMVWRFVAGNIKLISHMIYQKFHKVNDDMISDGVLGAYQALKDYDPKYSYSQFINYLSLNVFRRVREGSCSNITQVSPTSRALKRGKKPVYELPFDANIKNTDNLTLTDIVYDHTELTPADEALEKDDVQAFKDLLAKCKNNLYFKKYKELSQIISGINETQSAISQAALKTNTSEQNIRAKVKRMLIAVSRILNDDPIFKEEMQIILGHHGRDFNILRVQNRNKIKQLKQLEKLKQLKQLKQLEHLEKLKPLEINQINP